VMRDLYQRGTFRDWSFSAVGPSMSGVFRNVSFRERKFRDETFCIYIRNTAEIKVSLFLSKET
jgi:hypothetical protein